MRVDNSVLLFLASTFSSLKQCTVYADLPSFLSPCLITGHSLRPDLLLLIDEEILYILELTLGFETNIQNNSDRKAAKYSSLINDLSLSYSKVVFVNLSMGAIGVMGSSCNSLLSLLQELHFDKRMKAMNISIRSSYYIFCRRNKPWTNPELLPIYFPFSLFAYFHCIFFIFFIVSFCFMLYTSKPILHCHVLERCIIVFS